MTRAAGPSSWARLREARNDEAGVTAIEYALLIAGIAVAIIGIVFLLGSDIFAMYEGIHEKLGGKKDCAQAQQNCGNQ